MGLVQLSNCEVIEEMVEQSVKTYFIPNIPREK